MIGPPERYETPAEKLERRKAEFKDRNWSERAREERFARQCRKQGDKRADKLALARTSMEGQIFQLEFTSEHRVNGHKLLRPTGGVQRTLAHVPVGQNQAVQQNFYSTMADSANVFPDVSWNAPFVGNYAGQQANQAARSDSTSQTKNTPLQVRVLIGLEVVPGPSAPPFQAVLTRIRGASTDGSNYFDFALDNINQPVPPGQNLGWFNLTCLNALPNQVQRLANKSIQWTAEWTLNGSAKPEVQLGQSGPHTVYATLGAPGGQMQSQNPNTFTLDGPNQQITEGRLHFVIERVIAGAPNVANFDHNNERHHVDAVFLGIKALGVDFFLGHRWVPNQNQTGFSNKPPLHEFLWLSNSNQAKAECHNIAAAFVLACKMLGAQGNFALGFIYPWPGRQDAPQYPRLNDNPPIFGRYDNQYRRAPQVQDAPARSNADYDQLCFIDQNGGCNNFEGVARHNTTLYAIGEHILGRQNTADGNASDYFTRHDWNSTYVANVDQTAGSIDLAFARTLQGNSLQGLVQSPYPGLDINSPFRWEN